MVAATPGDSGLFDSDAEGDRETREKQEDAEGADNIRVMYSPAPSVKRENEVDVKDEVGSEGFTLTQQCGGKPAPISETWTIAAITRTAEFPSCVTRDVILTTNETGTLKVYTSVETRPSIVMGNNAMEAAMRMADTSMGDERRGPRWELGTPFYRNDGPLEGPHAQRMEQQIHGRNATMLTCNSTDGLGQQQVQMQPTQYSLGAHPTSPYGPANTMSSQAEYAQRFNEEMIRRNRAGPLTSTLVPPVFSVSPVSSGRNSPYTPTRYPQGNCTPMADVESADWAQFPANPPHHTHRWTDNGQRPVDIPEVLHHSRHRWPNHIRNDKGYGRKTYTPMANVLWRHPTLCGYGGDMMKTYLVGLVIQKKDL